MDVGGECGEGKRIGREDNGLFGGRYGIVERERL